ncbi:MAG TPA: aminotransferase class I/II-fold pyridoxal phosphate-dependent enzyme [Candidatus Eisenbacteria bacterium]|nr:aminotransferase class I/II-fold pyridoxal phosphate-dependent enzyme [Candidatus Eisenbacteria bacterium]
MSSPESTMAQISRRMISAKAEQFTESVIREMTRLALRHDAVNLSQGFPDFAAPQEIKEAARQAISDDINQYAITWGAKPLRDAIVEKFKHTQGVQYDAEREVTICCGSTEAMMSAMMAIINPGDEIVVFEPFYENYGPDAILSGASPRFVRMQPPSEKNPDWSFDREELAAAFGVNTKAIILNTPNNPTGKVFTRSELEFIRDLCVQCNAYCVTDEIYEHILYDGTEHISMARIEGMRERTIVINGMSKTYSVTGWRVGWALAPPQTTQAIRKVHDFLTVGAAAPLQQAGASALRSPRVYYDNLAANYGKKRERLLKILEASGFTVYKPRGAYYIMTDISRFQFPAEDPRFASATKDVAFAKYLVEEIGVACVPGSSFYNNAQDGGSQVRFTFCKKEETLAAAEARFAKLRR